jgi:hypothetical protein
MVLHFAALSLQFVRPAVLFNGEANDETDGAAGSCLLPVPCKSVWDMGTALGLYSCFEQDCQWQGGALTAVHVEGDSLQLLLLRYSVTCDCTSIFQHQMLQGDGSKLWFASGFRTG